MEQFLLILKCLNVIGLNQKIDIFDKIITEDHSGTIDYSMNFGDFLISEEEKKEEEEYNEEIIM